MIVFKGFYKIVNAELQDDGSPKIALSLQRVSMSGPQDHDAPLDLTLETREILTAHRLLRRNDILECLVAAQSEQQGTVKYEWVIGRTYSGLIGFHGKVIS